MYFVATQYKTFKKPYNLGKKKTIKLGESNEKVAFSFNYGIINKTITSKGEIKVNNKDMVDLKEAFFHGLAGLEVSFVMYPKDGLYLSMVKLNSILQHKGIYSREKMKELGIYYPPEFGYHINYADVNMTNNYVSICRKNEEMEDTAFEEFIEGKISIALSPDITKKFHFRNKINYCPDPGEEQVLDRIGIEEFIAIVIDIKDEKYRQIAIEKTAELLKRYKCPPIPITDINGNQLIVPLQEKDNGR